MSHAKTSSTRARRAVPAALVLCACLLLPAAALAYGGGGDIGGSGNKGGGPQVQSMPSSYPAGPYEIGIEGMPVEPAPGDWGGYYTPDGTPAPHPGPRDTPWCAPPEYQFVEDMVKDQIQDKIIEMALASNPELLAAVKALQAANGVYEFTRDAKQKLDKARKDYQKALIGNLGSNLQAPPTEIPEMSSYTPGGGPALLHDNNFLQ